MSEKKPAKKGTQKSSSGFTAEERAAMRERAHELKARPRGGKTDGEQDVLAKIAEMGPPDRVIAQRLHAIIRATAPTLSPRTWYGMPAYAKDGEIVCYFQPAEKFKARYATLGFSDQANLDEGHIWPTVYAVTELTYAEEARIVTLLKKALG